MTGLERFNLTLRGFMELGVVCGLGYWGWCTGGSTPIKLLLAVAAPVLGFGFWGAVDFRQAGPLAEPLRLVQELVISGLAAMGLWVVGAHRWGAALGVVSVVHHAMVYLLGGRLLKG